MRPEHLKHILDDVRTLPEAPAGQHVLGNEILAYVEGCLSGKDIFRVEAHIKSCEECAEEAELLAEYEDAPTGVHDSATEKRNGNEPLSIQEARDICDTGGAHDVRATARIKRPSWIR